MGLRKQSVLRVTPLEDRSLPSAAFVADWNNQVLDVQRLRGQGNPQSARALAILDGAIYDSVNAVAPTHTVYHVDARAFPGAATASADAAAAQAAHDVAYALYTVQLDRDAFDARLSDELDELLTAGVTGIAEGVALGQYVAAQMLAWRANDGSGAVVSYTPGTDPGDWQPTPRPGPTPGTELPGLAASSPQWPYVVPFAMQSGDQFRAGPPPALTSDKYTEAYQEVKSLGDINSATRTPEQTEIALFWAGLGVSNSGIRIWNQIAETVAAERDLSLAENARLFAQVNVASADAFIASYDTKYAYNYWRPVTAIRAGDTDGNPDTVADPTWTPLFATPNHPSYGSNHSAQSRAAAEALAAFFGTDQVPFAASFIGTDPALAGLERSFNKFTDAAKEAGKSRVYAGIHWSFDCAQGENVGRKVGQYVAGHFFQPLADQLTAAAAPSTTVHRSLRDSQIRPLLSQAIARWQSAGVDTSALGNINVRIADLGGLTLGRAAPGVITLDDNAAGWGWYVDRTARTDAEFTRRGNQGEQNRMDLLTVLEHEVGHLLGYDHEPGGLMKETLNAGTRITVGPTATSPGATPNLVSWTPDSPWVGDGLIVGKRK